MALQIKATKLRTTDTYTSFVSYGNGYIATIAILK